MDTETAGGGMVRLRWRGGRSCHAQLVADTVASYHAHHQGDLALVVQGRTIPCHAAVVAAASPYLATLVRDTSTDTGHTLSLVGITYSQAILVVQFMYKGVLERLSEQEISQLLDSVRHLEIVGMRGGSQEAAGIKMEAMDIEEDDVFTDQAVDLSPVNRHPPTPLLSGNLDLASRRMASLSKISQALLRNSESSGSSKSSTSGSGESRGRGSTSGSFGQDNHHPGDRNTDRFLARIKKPKPLTALPRLEGECSHPAPLYLKPRTPRTPLLVSPDCHALEERFRTLIESSAADSEKLRNLSVSSADFNFETSSAGGGGGSLPNTPLRTPRSFNFPPFCATAANTPATSAASGSLDLSIKRVESGDEEEEAETAAIPTINVIKPEPEDSGEDTARSGGCSPPPPLHFVTTVTKSSPGNRGDDADPDSPPSDPLPSPGSVKVEPSSLLFPQFPLPLAPFPLPPSPLPYLGPASPGPDTQGFRLVLPATQRTFPNNGSSKRPPQPTGRHKDLAASASGGGGGGSKSAKDSKEQQQFKCQKCGKCYRWNYNLNRHMRFECGIENRFECSMCQKRFPYKQNVAIHLKRKHKLQLDNADDMIAQGHITLLPAGAGKSQDQ